MTKDRPESAPRRVAFVYEGVAYGGTEEYLLLLLRYLDPRRYTPVVIVPGFSFRLCPPRFIERVEALGVRLFTPAHSSRSRSISFVQDVREMSRFLGANGTDILHIHTSRPDAGRRATLAAGVAGVPVILRSEHLPPSSNWYSGLRQTIKPFDWLTCNIIVGSQACCDEQLRLLRRDPAKVICAYYGIELERFDPVHDVRSAKRHLGLNPDLPVVGTVGRLVPEKGHTYFIDAAARILAEWGPAQFLLVGDGSLERELREQVARLGLGPHFHFAGFQPDTVPYIQAMDVAAMPSISEGISLAMLEFMAMGKPVVATREPSFQETIVDNKSGLFVALQDSDALAAGIIHLLSDPALAERLGRGAVERVHALFGIADNVNCVMNIYDAALGVTTPLPLVASL